MEKTKYEEILNKYSFLGEWPIGDLDKELSLDDVNKYKVYYHYINQDLRDFNVNRPVFYGKFLRNLIELYSSDDSDNTTRSKCRKLNNWLYVIRKKPGYTFDEMRSVLNLTGKFDKDIYDNYKCGFEWLSHESEFENIIKLYNFNEYIHNNEDKFSNISKDKYADFCEYVHGCIATYNKINKIYCNVENNKDNKVIEDSETVKSNKDYSTLCKELELFKQNYDKNVVNWGKLIGKVPCLEDNSKSLRVNCIPQNQRADCGRFKKLRSNAVGAKSQIKSDRNDRGRLVPDSSNVNTKYHIFDKLHIYEKSETKSETPGYINWPNYVCNTTKKPYDEWDSDATEICKDFVRLFIFMSQDRHTKTVLDINDYKFLNFWLNKKLREKGKEDKFIQNFFTYLNSKKNIIDDDNKLSGKLEHISSDEWEKMDVLYNLHYNYSKIRNEIFSANKEEECKKYANNCVEKMEKAIDEYGENPDTEFYDALREFSYLYTYDQYNSESCRNVKLPPLPKLKPSTKNSRNPQQDGKETEAAEREVKKVEKVITCDEESKTLHIVNFLNTDDYHILLKDLNVLDEYEKLNKSESLDYKKYCEDICDLEENFPGAKALCMKTSKNLEDISKEQHPKRIEACEHFYYWLSDHIWSLFGKNERYIKDKPAALNFLSIVYDIMYRLNIPECLFHYNPYDSEDILREKKHLYYYFKYHDKIKNAIIRTKVGGEDNLHCKYLNYIRKLYEKYVPRCCSCFSGPNKCSEYCKEYFTCDERYYPAELLTELGCNGEKPIKSAGEIFKNVTVNRKDLIIRQSNLTGYSFGELYKDPFYRFAFSGFTLLGILSTFFVFYKFTPVGIWLNRGRSNRRDITQAMLEKHMQQELSDLREIPPKIKSQKKRLRIAYQNN